VHFGARTDGTTEICTAGRAGLPGTPCPAAGKPDAARERLSAWRSMVRTGTDVISQSKTARKPASRSHRRDDTDQIVRPRPRQRTSTAAEPDGALTHFAWKPRTTFDDVLPAPHIQRLMNKLSFLPECYIEAIRRAGPGHIDIIARSRRIQTQSPACSDTSRTVHSRYHRHPADLPALGYEIRISLVVPPDGMKSPLRLLCRTGCQRLRHSALRHHRRLVGHLPC
jgi:hypothetical protein